MRQMNHKYLYIVPDLLTIYRKRIFTNLIIAVHYCRKSPGGREENRYNFFKIKAERLTALQS